VAGWEFGHQSHPCPFITATTYRAGVPLRDPRKAAHAGPNTTMRNDWTHTSPDRHGTKLKHHRICPEPPLSQAHFWVSSP
jgi:hypothetical protein